MLSKYHILGVQLTATPEDIIAFWERAKDIDPLRAASLALEFLPGDRVAPYIDPNAPSNWRDVWVNRTTDDLRRHMAHYAEWWREKITMQRGLSMVVGWQKFVVCMMLAGLPEWEDLYFNKPGESTVSVFNKRADLFGFPKFGGFASEQECRDYAMERIATGDFQVIDLSQHRKDHKD